MPHILRCGERGRQTPFASLWKAAALRRVRLREEKGAQPYPAVRKREAHGQSRSCADNTSCFGFGNGESPGAAHCVPDLSRPGGHHSDLLAGTLTPFRRQSRKTGAPSCYSVLFYCTTCRGKLQEGICPAAVFFMCRGAEALPCPTVSAYFTTSWLAAEPKMSCHAASTLAASSCASFASSAVLSSGPCPRISSAT